MMTTLLTALLAAIYFLVLTPLGLLLKPFPGLRRYDNSGKWTARKDSDAPDQHATSEG